MKKIVNTVFNRCYQSTSADFRSKQVATFLLLFIYGASIVFISTVL